MNPRVHSPTISNLPTKAPEDSPEFPPIPDFTTLDIQQNPFFRFTTPADFSSDDEDEENEEEMGV